MENVEADDGGVAQGTLWRRIFQTWPTLAVLVALSITGYLTGWLTGLSESPVTGVVLPLLFTLIAGSGGFHLATASFDSRAVRRRIGRIALATAVFMASCWLGVHWGILNRTTLAPADKGWTPTQLSGLPASEILRLSGIQKKLALLGVEQQVIRAFEARYVEEYTGGGAADTDGGPTSADIDELVRALKVVASVLETADGRPAALSRVRRFQQNMPNYLGHLETLRKLAAVTGRSVPVDHYREFLETIGTDNSALLEHREGNKDGTVLNAAPAMDYIPLYALQMVIAIQQESAENGKAARPSGDIDQGEASLDSALRLASGSSGEAVPDQSNQRRYSVKR